MQHTTVYKGFHIHESYTPELTVKVQTPTHRLIEATSVLSAKRTITKMLSLAESSLIVEEFRQDKAYYIKDKLIALSFGKQLYLLDKMTDSLEAWLIKQANHKQVHTSNCFELSVLLGELTRIYGGKQ
jgi:hypothetical protein